MPDTQSLVPFAKSAITVATTANPSPESLLAARAAVDRSLLLRDIFCWAREEGWDRSRLVEVALPILVETLASPVDDVRQAVEYLADEYAQVGHSALIIARDTGRAIAALSEEDMWQPAQVPREDGSMATPLARLRPEIEAYLIQWQHDQARDRNLLAEMESRSNQTPMLRDMGDLRLLPVTGDGRRVLSSRIRDSLSSVLPSLQGAAQRFLQCFEIRTSEHPVASSSDFRSQVRCTAVARVRVPVGDPLSFNVHFDRYTQIMGAIGLGWVRDIAQGVSTLVHAGSLTPIPLSDLRREDLAAHPIWVAGPDEALAMRGATYEPIECLIIEGVVPFGISPQAGIIVIDPGSYKCEAREVFDRWELIATFDYSVHLDFDPSRVTPLPLEGVARVALRKN